jgi:hypothetical protein
LYGRKDAAWIAVPGAEPAIITGMVASTALSGHRVVMADSSGEAAYPDISILADALAIVGITTGAISFRRKWTCAGVRYNG